MEEGADSRGGQYDAHHETDNDERVGDAEGEGDDPEKIVKDGKCVVLTYDSEGQHDDSIFNAADKD